MKAAHAILFVAVAGVALVFALAWRASAWRHSVTRVALSLFEPHAGGCAWSRWDVERGDDEEIAHFPADCANVHAAWGPKGQEALVWFTPDGFASREDMLYLVEVPTQKLKRLPLPSVGEGQTYLIDAAGRIVAFTENQNVSLVSASGDDGGDERLLLEWRGRRWPLDAAPEDGQAVLAHALVLNRKTLAWSLVETTPTRCCADGAPGFRILSTYGRLAAEPGAEDRRTAPLTRRAPQGSPVSAAPLLTASTGLPATLDYDPTANDWRLLADPAWPRALLYRLAPGDPTRAGGVALFAEHGKARAMPGYAHAASDVLTLTPRGSYLLITDWGTGTEPHLYDMATGQLVYSSTVTTETTFWPVPALP